MFEGAFKKVLLAVVAMSFSYSSLNSLSSPCTMTAMKKNLHPQYYPKAKVKCACGNTFTVGATRQEMTVEICSHCHPFYTGTEKLLDIAGRVEKFRTRQEKAGVAKVKAKVKKLITEKAMNQRSKGLQALKKKPKK